MATIDKSRAPFTYTGNWELHDYDNGKKYYARLLTSGSLTPKREIIADVFLVGGGGGGGGCYQYVKRTSGDYYYRCGIGGGGGYTSKALGYRINGATSVLIGAGGYGGGYGHIENGGVPITFGVDGGETSFGNLSAGGGFAGSCVDVKTALTNGSGCGGSGGGVGDYFYDYANTATQYGGGGGTNGSDGNRMSNSGFTIPAGSNASTRAFGGDVNPFSSMLFSGGGGGGAMRNSACYPGGAGGGGKGAYYYFPIQDKPSSYPEPSVAAPGTQNTGGGGGGGSGPWGAGSGGSGIVILRGELNQPPTAPATIIAPDTAISTQPVTVSWSASTDPDGDALTYILERSYNGGGYAQVFASAGLTFSETVSTDWDSIQYRVKARDSYGDESAYTTSSPVTVIHNRPPDRHQPFQRRPRR